MKTGTCVIEITDDCLVEDLALGRLQTHRPDQDQPMKFARRHRRHLGGDPPAKAEADQRSPVDAEISKQPLIYDRNIAHAAQPLWPLGPAIARMLRNDDVEAARQRVIKVEPLRGADVVMQHKDRPPGAGARKMQLHRCHLDRRLVPLRAGRHHDTSPRVA